MYPDPHRVHQKETFDDHVTREFIDDGQIVIIERQGKTTPANVDRWFEVVLETYHNWQPNQPMFLLSDISDSRQSITTYSRQRASEFQKHTRSDFKLFMALVMPDSLMSNLMSIILHRIRQDNVMRVFTDRQKALDWLREQATLYTD